jgi:hypothetical protein
VAVICNRRVNPIRQVADNRFSKKTRVEIDL